MTVTFEDRDGKTLVTFLQTGFERDEDRDGFTEGWTVYLETLGRVVSKVPGIADEPGQPELKARHD